MALLALGVALEGLLRSFLYRNLRGELLEASNQVVRLLNLGGQALLEAGLPPSLYAEVQLLPEENPALLAKEGGISLQKSPALGQGRLLLGEAQYRASWKGARSGPRWPFPGREAPCAFWSTPAGWRSTSPGRCGREPSWWASPRRTSRPP